MESNQSVPMLESVPVARKNVYTCDDCRRSIVTVDREDGVTPMFLSCHATDRCPGRMQSAFYIIAPEFEKNQPTWEWRKPTDQEYKKLNKATREDHVDRGGLLLYPIDDDALKHRPRYNSQIRFDAHKSKSARQTLKNIKRQAIRKAKRANGGRLTDEQMSALQEGVHEAILNVKDANPNAGSFEELAVVNQL